MSTIRFSIELLRKVFIGTNMKDAYMKAVKWYATNIISKDELHNISVEYIKNRGFTDNNNGLTQSPSITMILYVSMEESEVRTSHCNVCKEVHKSFLFNQPENCNSCKLLGYQKRLDDKINIKRNFYRETLHKSKIYKYNP